MTRDEFLDLLARLRRASVGGIRAPHKPLLLLWLFGRFAAVGSSARLAGQALLAPRPGQPFVELDHISWHHRQVFKGADAEAA